MCKKLVHVFISRHAGVVKGQPVFRSVCVRCGHVKQ